MQRGTITISDTAANQTATVTSSSATLSELAYLGATCAYSADGVLDSVLAHLTQNSATQIQATRTGTSGALVVGYELATYSGTYFDRAECLNLTTAATNFVDFANAGTYFFDNDVIGSYAGQKTNASNSDLTGDFASIIEIGSKGDVVRRGAAGPNAVTVGYNRIAVKPGYVKRKLIVDNLGVLVDSAFLTIGAQYGPIILDYLGQRATGTMTKSSFNPARAFSHIESTLNSVGTTFLTARRKTASVGAETVTPVAQVVEWVQ